MSCVFQGKISQASGSQSVDPGPATSTSPGNLLEMHVLNRKFDLCLASPPGDSRATNV